MNTEKIQKTIAKLAVDIHAAASGKGTAQNNLGYVRKRAEAIAALCAAAEALELWGD